MEYSYKKSLFTKTLNFKLENGLLLISNEDHLHLEEIPLKNITKINFQIIPATKYIPTNYRVRVYEGEKKITYGNLNYKSFAIFKDHKDSFNAFTKAIVEHLNPRTVDFSKGSGIKLTITINILMSIATTVFFGLAILLYNQGNTMTTVIMIIGAVFSLVTWKRLIKAYKFKPINSRKEFLELLP